MSWTPEPFSTTTSPGVAVTYPHPDSPPRRARWRMYRSTEDKLNDAFERIHDDGGDVVYVFHKGARDYTVIYKAPDKP
jgi:hypothetical protein